MSKHSSDSARLFRQPTGAERAQGKTMRIEPPYSESVMEKAISWLWAAIGAGVAVTTAFIVLLWLILS